MEDRDNRLVPTRVFHLMEHHIAHVACGLNHTIASTSTHQLYGWGACDSGQLGVMGEAKSRTAPIRITSHELLQKQHPIIAIAAGADTSAIIISPHPSPSIANHSHPHAHIRPSLITSFSLSHYTSLLNTATSTKDYAHIMSYVASIWSNPMVLNASFMDKKVRIAVIQ